MKNVGSKVQNADFILEHFRCHLLHMKCFCLFKETILNIKLLQFYVLKLVSLFSPHCPEESGSVKISFHNVLVTK